MKLGKFFGVGTGPGDPRYLTLLAVDIFRQVDIIFTVVGVNSSFSVSQRIVDSVAQVKAEKRKLPRASPPLRPLRRYQDRI